MAGDSTLRSVRDGFLCILIITSVRMLMIYTGILFIHIPLVDRPLRAIVNWLKVQPFSAYLNQVVDLFKGF